MVTLEQAKGNLLKEIITPIGEMKLYGLNLLPNSNGMGLIFYKEDGERVIFFSDDCFIKNK